MKLGYILTGNELIDGEPELGIELRQESLYLLPPEGQRHAFGYALEGLNNYGGQISTVELPYSLLRQIIRWATSEQGRQLLKERGVEVDW